MITRVLHWSSRKVKFIWPGKWNWVQPTQIALEPISEDLELKKILEGVCPLPQNPLGGDTPPATLAPQLSSVLERHWIQYRINEHQLHEELHSQCVKYTFSCKKCSGYAIHMVMLASRSVRPPTLPSSYLQHEQHVFLHLSPLRPLTKRGVSATKTSSQSMNILYTSVMIYHRGGEPEWAAHWFTHLSLYKAGFVTHK